MTDHILIKRDKEVTVTYYIVQLICYIHIIIAFMLLLQFLLSK